MIELKDIPRSALINLLGRDLEAIQSGVRGEVYRVLAGNDFHAYLLASGSSAEEAAVKVEKHKQLYLIRAADSQLH